MFLLKLTKNLLRNKHGKSPVDVCRPGELKDQLLKAGLLQRKSSVAEKSPQRSSLPKDELRDNRIEKVQLNLMSQ
jgi:hypothetical protein